MTFGHTDIKSVLESCFNFFIYFVFFIFLGQTGLELHEVKKIIMVTLCNSCILLIIS